MIVMTTMIMATTATLLQLYTASQYMVSFENRQFLVKANKNKKWPSVKLDVHVLVRILMNITTKQTFHGDG